MAGSAGLSSKEDVPALMKAVCAAVSKPVIMAGSIDTPERICVVKEVGAAPTSIGTAALDGRYPAIANDLPGQLEAIIRDTADLNKHLSPIHKENLAKAFSDVSGLGVPKVTGQIGTTHSKLAFGTAVHDRSFLERDMGCSCAQKVIPYENFGILMRCLRMVSSSLCPMASSAARLRWTALVMYC